MAKDGTPLPSALSGTIAQRLIEIDEALLYLVNGALVYLMDKEPLEQTGTLTPETAKNALSVMFYTYLDETVTIMPIGTMTPFPSASIPDRWLLCDGTAINRTTYAKLFDVIGVVYGAGDGATTFNLPDMRNRSAYGVGAGVVTALGQQAGTEAQGLTIANLPSHDHDYDDPGHSHRIAKQSATVNAAVNVVTPAARTDNPATPHVVTDSALTGITFHAQGSNIPHNNVHPVLGVNFIIYAGV